MRNIFALTKREQRIVIAIVTLLVAASLAKHYLEIRSERRLVRSTSTVSPTATPMAPVRAQDLIDDNAPTPDER